MAKKETVELNLGQVVILRNDESRKVEDIGQGNNNYVEILPVTDIKPGEYIKAEHYVLPINDATKMNSDNGLVYLYNVSLPYLQEAAHLAEVEKNIVFGSAFMYPGRNMNQGKPNLFQWMLVVAIFLLGAFAIFAK